MKVLQFAFDGDPDNAHLPHNYSRNTVCYTGTHDNDTLAGWLSKDRKSLKYAKEYLGFGRLQEAGDALLRAGMSSVADLFIAPAQDWLRLGSEARINTPGTADGNWTWRLTEKQMEAFPCSRIREMTKRYGRLTSF